MGLFFIFFIIAIIRSANNFVEENSQTSALPANLNGGTLANYLPLVFHVVICILILITLFAVEVISEERVSILIGDISFQFFSTLLLVIIGLISPFTTLRPETAQKLTELNSKHKNPFADWLLQGKNFRWMKITLSIALTCYFIFSGSLKFPALNGSLTSSIAVFLIFFYLLNSIIQLFRNPAQFRRNNILRLNILFKSIKSSFFILIGTIVLLFIPSAIIGFKFVDEVNPLIFALLGYNVIMAYNEYKLLKLIHQPNGV